MQCRYTSAAVRALRNGEYPDELQSHLQACAECRAAMELARLLQQDAAVLQRSFAPPPVAHIWTEAERFRQAAALESTAAIMQGLKAASVAYAAIFVAWTLWWVAHASSIVLPSFDSRALHIALAGIGFAIFCAGSGLIYAMRGDGPRTA